MSEKPILFRDAWMIQAILEDRKSQTRRLVKSLPHDATDFWTSPDSPTLEFGYHGRIHGAVVPKYMPGDRLVATQYHGSSIDPCAHPGCHSHHSHPCEGCGRIWAEIPILITDVRPERVQEISEEDCEAEGIFNSSGMHLYDCCSSRSYHPDQMCRCGDLSPQEEFSQLIDSIYPGIWQRNDYVWAYTFKRITCES